MGLFDFSSTIAVITVLISLVSIVGILLGDIRIRGVGIGIGGVLFGGIFVGWLASYMGWIPSAVALSSAAQSSDPKVVQSYAKFVAFNDILHYMQEFGLILFVYTIGVQVGPGFFASMKGNGLKLNSFAVLIVLLGSVIATCYCLFFGMRIDHVIGIYSGAVTNTPALGAGQQMLDSMVSSFTGAEIDARGLVSANVPKAYAMAYPFGVLGIIMTMFIIRMIFRIDVNKEGERYDLMKKSSHKALNTQNVVLKNPQYFGKKLGEVLALQNDTVLCSRLKRSNVLMVPKADEVLQEGDILHLVGDGDKLLKASENIGESIKVSLSTKGTEFEVKKVVVTNEKVFGKTLEELDLKSRHEVVISRIIRTGVGFIPHRGTVLNFGDQLNLVGRPESIEEVIKIVGNSAAALSKVKMLPIFVGLALGMCLGCFSLPIPGLTAPLKLGLAGGPLVVAILLSCYGHTITFNRMNWFMPAAGNSALREIGIVLFLAIVGFRSGANGFFDDLLHGDGLTWMGMGVFVTFIPIFIAGVLAYKVAHVNYLQMCGMMAGSMTDPPALAFANGLYKNSEASALSYATVYPLTMFLRILSPQFMISCMVALGG
ncbi:putative transporter [Succinimonas amylolytica]|uniref:putative transporter n=1 Tax=Succinimonas amylolytica TaxID=83769 RepID=UPI0005C6F007|nr:putative transporter [Succinimonas amylolytica]